MRKPPVRLLSLDICRVLATYVAACRSTTPGPAAKTFKIGLVTDTGGLNDKSFNHLAAVGLSKAASTGNICSSLSCKNELGVQGDVTESHVGSEYGPNLPNSATRGYDPRSGVGCLMAEGVGTVSAHFPTIHF